MNKVSFLIAIDSYIIRKGIVSVLKNISDTAILADTDNPDVFIHRLKDLSPDLIIISNHIYNKISRIYEEDYSLDNKTILLLPDRTHNPPERINTILFADCSKEQLISQITRVMKPFLHQKRGMQTAALSEREKTILKNVAKGLTNKQIADILFLSLHTVTTHRKNICSKLGIKSVSGLTVYAIVNNIISIEDISEINNSG